MKDDLFNTTWVASF